MVLVMSKTRENMKTPSYFEMYPWAILICFTYSFSLFLMKLDYFFLDLFNLIRIKIYIPLTFRFSSVAQLPYFTLAYDNSNNNDEHRQRNVENQLKSVFWMTKRSLQQKLFTQNGKHPFQIMSEILLTKSKGGGVPLPTIFPKTKNFIHIDCEYNKI